MDIFRTCFNMVRFFGWQKWPNRSPTSGTQWEDDIRPWIDARGSDKLNEWFVKHTVIKKYHYFGRPTVYELQHEWWFLIFYINNLFEMTFQGLRVIIFSNRLWDFFLGPPFSSLTVSINTKIFIWHLYMNKDIRK